jgi:hypothetical protein
VVSAGTAAACLFAATRFDLRNRAVLLTLYAVAAVTAAPALWFFPGTDLWETFYYVNPDMLAGTRWGWLTLIAGSCVVGLSTLVQVVLKVSNQWDRRWQLGTAAAVAATSTLALTLAVVLAQ